MSSPFVAAAVQSSPVVFETKATLAKVRNLTAEAASRARLAVFPEAFVSSYPKGRHRDCPVDYAAVQATRRIP